VGWRGTWIGVALLAQGLFCASHLSSYVIPWYQPPIRQQELAAVLPRFPAEAHPELAFEGQWRVVVLNDPVNLMSYVVLVFKKVFGFDEQTARRKMLEVHEQGRSIVWSGLREKAEAYVYTLQQWHLTAILEPDETH